MIADTIHATLLQLARHVPVDRFERMLENSYKDFHAKGMDYICLRRWADGVTYKVYFLNGDVTKLPEVVNPHDHRYDFQTMVLAGAMLDHRFAIAPRDARDAKVYQRFQYMTPLNGGNGFDFESEQALRRVHSEPVAVGQRIVRRYSEVHTIQMTQDQTVLLLAQHMDRLPLDRPTTCWVARGEPKPDTAGLYSQFTPDELAQRLQVIAKLMSNLRIGQ